MTPPIIEKKRVLLLAIGALAVGASPASCSSDSPGTSGEPYDSSCPCDASGIVDTGYDQLREGGNIFPSYDAYVETDSDVDDAADGDAGDDAD